MKNNHFAVVVHKEVNGLEVGVFDDGTTYATSQGLAQLCGVRHQVILDIMYAWDSGVRCIREVKIQQLLREASYEREALHATIFVDGVLMRVYPEEVVMAIVGYYAFEVDRPNKVAQKSYRTLGLAGFRRFVYLSVGYEPSGPARDWKLFHERHTLNRPPPGYFSVFSELSTFMLDAIRNGLPCDQHTIPDISVGLAWSRHWKRNGVEAKYGKRTTFPHIYPDSYDQSEEPVYANIYPIAALPEFRWWLHEHYLPLHFPNYLEAKVRKGTISSTTAETLAGAVCAPMLLAG